MDRGGLVSTPDLRPSLRSILEGLDESGYLSHVATTLALSSQRLDQLRRVPVLGGGLRQLLGRRELPAFLEGKTTCLWRRELLRTAVARTGRQRLTHAVWKWAELGFDAAVARRFGGRYAFVYGMEHSSAATFAAQKARGGKNLLRQVTAHGRTLAAVLRREAERFPQYVTPYYRMLLREADDIIARKEREYALADLIVANSDYVRQTFVDNGVDPAKVVAIPTGCPPVDPIGARAGAGSGPLRFLYVGSGSLRKGFPYLLEAWRALDPGPAAELWVAGPCEIPLGNVLAEEPGLRYLGVLHKDALRQAMRESDVMVLPTLCEGLAHSVLEAMAVGLPIITTVESGAGHRIEHGANGLIVPAGSVEHLAAAMEKALALRPTLAEMGARSAERPGLGQWGRPIRRTWARWSTSWKREQSNGAVGFCMADGAGTLAPRAQSLPLLWLTLCPISAAEMAAYPGEEMCALRAHLPLADRCAGWDPGLL
jgi:glycosyltransferase involved in cell wall biosynthesis